MAREIEAKLKLDDPEALAQRLKEVSARWQGEVVETNAIYDTEDRSLLAADKALRIRSARDVNSSAVHCTMTYKGPVHPGRFKNRDEIEMTVSDAHIAGELLERLGFARVFRFQKHRQSWKLGECKVEIDRLPYLGAFLEIEGPSEEAIAQTRQILQLADRPVLRGSYVGMLVAHLQERGDNIVDVTFPGPER